MDLNKELAADAVFHIDGLEPHLRMHDGIPTLSFFISEMDYDRDEKGSSLQTVMDFADHIVRISDNTNEVALYLTLPVDQVLNNFFECNGWLNEETQKLHVGESDKPMVDKTIEGLKSLLAKLENIVYDPDEPEPPSLVD